MLSWIQSHVYVSGYVDQHVYVLKWRVSVHTILFFILNKGAMIYTPKEV